MMSSAVLAVEFSILNGYRWNAIAVTALARQAAYQG